MRQVRIFVSSPGDCAQERALLDEAVERINRSEMDRSGILLRTFAWEHDVVPRIGPPPQAVVDEQTPLCDIYVGIMSARFGGEGTRESGTEQEFRQALIRFGDLGQPWILFYFNEQPQLQAKKEAAQEWAKVLAFREELETKGIVGGYAGARGSVKGFFETIELHLRTILQRFEFQQASSGQAARDRARTERRGAPGKPIVPPQYLAWLQSKCAGVDLFGLEPKYGSAARLQSIYVPLTTKWRAGPRIIHREVREVQPPELLLDRFADDESLYVSGPPGSGKSTFCRWVTWLACMGQMPVTALVDAPDRYRETWPGALGGRLPLLVRLREWWRALPARPGSRELSRQDFERCLANWIDENSEGLDGAEQVVAHLEAGSALIVLDGVDEVPLAHDEGRAQWFPRSLLLSGLSNAMSSWTAAGNRLLVTSRPYGLLTGSVTAQGLQEAPILDLGSSLRRLLVDRWFQQLRPGQEGTQYANDLAAHLEEHPWLEPLSVNPLLLTAMCIVFDEGGRLPQDKYELYVRVVNTVLNSRYRDDVEGRERARYRLQAIAYGMHTGQGLGEKRVTPDAVVSHQDLDRILREYLDKSASKEEGNTTTVVAREELLSQSGLFLGRGDNTAGFYHLSFQEFLAGQRLVDVEDDLLAVFLERAEVLEWHNTLSLLFAGLTREKAARLVTGLVQALSTKGPHAQLLVADCIEILLARGVRLDYATEETCSKALLAMMLSGAPAGLRCRVGSILGRLGDPRFHDKSLWCLAKDPMLGFVEVPAGSFIMGVGEESHQVWLPSFLIARYPVTVAQFRAFAADAKRNPAMADWISGVPNHPARVTWDDALTYSQWLDAALRASSAIPERLQLWLDEADGWRVTLPSEAEWERVARGATERLNPWGRGSVAQNVSGVAAGIFDSRWPVGAFSSGATPDSEGGVEDLISSVGQWTRSQLAPYPYEWDDGRESLDRRAHVPRIARGGFTESTDALATYRFALWTNRPTDAAGLRVAVSCLAF